MKTSMVIIVFTLVTLGSLSPYTDALSDGAPSSVVLEPNFGSRPLIALPLSAAAGAQKAPTLKELAARHDERPRDPWIPGPGTPPRGYRPLPAPPTVGPYVSIQANVDACGNNIPGDAANEPSIAVDPTAPNRIVLGWRQFDNVESDFRQAGWAWSRDGGRTWAFPGVLEPGVFRSDPVLDSDATGNLYYMSLSRPGGEFMLDLFISGDGGMTWGAPTPAFGGDKEWVVIDRTGGLGDGHIYTAWQRASPFFPNQFTRSIDGGASFEPPIPLPSMPVFGTLTVASDGALYVSGTDFPADPDEFHVLRSDDAQDPGVGPTFALDATVDLGGSMVLGDGPNPIGLLGQSWVATDLASGDAYLLGSVDPPGDDPLDVHIVRSEDGGVSWSDPVRVNDDPAGNEAWQWFGTMSVAPNGRIDVIWNDTRNDPDNPNPTTSELFYSFSDDGGETWAPNVPVSLPFEHFVGYPMNEKLGDYYHMISDDVGAHVAYAATHNGEQDIWSLRIGDYDCNGNGTADTDDIAGGTSEDCNENAIPDDCEIAAGASVDANDNGVPDECEALAAALDIRPGSCPNPLNFRSRGVLPVAILGTASFDVRDVDLSSVRIARLNGRGGSLAPIEGPPGPHPTFEDVGTPFLGSDCDCHSAGGDGFEDLVLHFEIETLVETLVLACELPGAVVALEVSGELLDGTAFAAMDCVRIVPVLAFEPNPVLFQTVPPVCEAITIRNVGITTAEILSVAGCETDGFSLNTSGMATEIAPGESTAFEICLTDSPHEPRSCTVVIATNAESDTVVARYDVATDVAEGSGLPHVLTVFAPQPNPFNPRLVIRYALPVPGLVWATVYDQPGRHVCSLLHETAREAGAHELVWNGTNDHGIAVANGVYSIRFRVRAEMPTTRNEERVVRAVLLR